MTWDEKRVQKILASADVHPDDLKEVTAELVALVGGVRTEAITWTWTLVLQQHDQGRDPHRQPLPELLVRVIADLNPERGE